MRNKPVDVVGGGAGGIECIDDHIGYHADRMLEHLAAFHPQITDRLRRGRTAIDEQFRLVPAVGTQMRREDAAVRGLAGLLLRLKHDGAGAIAEQHAGATVIPVENARKGLGAYHQRALESAAAQKIVRGSEREDEAGAYRL